VVPPLLLLGATPPVVGDNEQGGFAPVLWLTLHVLPELADQLVRIVGRVQIRPVFAHVGKLIGVAKAEI
jgi:hypothetical protein